MSIPKQWTGRLLATTSPIKKTRVAQERSEERRTAFLNDLQPYLLHPERLVFLDERGFHTAMTRGYARAPRHPRAVCAVPRNHGQNQSLICALSLAGPIAPLVIDGPVNGEVFEWDVREELCPALSAGQVVILENLSSHHRASIRTLVEAQGCTLLYLSPYSPDFNPIELLSSKLKAWVRGDAPRRAPFRTSSIVLEPHCRPSCQMKFGTGSNMLILKFFCDKCSMLCKWNMPRPPCAATPMRRWPGGTRAAGRRGANGWSRNSPRKCLASWGDCPPRRRRQAVNS